MIWEGGLLLVERKVIWECGLLEMERKVIWECGLGGEESDLGTWIRWRGK